MDVGEGPLASAGYSCKRFYCPLFTKNGDQYVDLQTTTNRHPTVSHRPPQPVLQNSLPPPLHTIPMDTICERFLQAERDFIVAARSNGSFLMDFAERWEALQSEWGSCLHEADHTTQQLVDGVAARIERLAEDLSMVRSHSMSLEEDLLHSLEEVFASLTLEDVVDCAGPASTEVSSFVGSRCADLPAEWLLRNLHNPYPPPHTRFSPDPTAGSKHMKDWFSKARQRIGWTRLLRDRFAGCRSLAIDAAFRAFVRDDPNNPLDPDLKTAFTAIKSHAELVYGDEDVTSPSPKRLRSISPTPSLAYSLSSEDTDDDQSPILPSEISSIHPLKRRLSETSGSFSTKRIRLAVRHFIIAHH